MDGVELSKGEWFRSESRFTVKIQAFSFHLVEFQLRLVGCSDIFIVEIHSIFRSKLVVIVHWLGSVSFSSFVFSPMFSLCLFARCENFSDTIYDHGRSFFYFLQ